MRLIVGENENAYEVVGNFIEQFLIAKENEENESCDIKTVSGMFIVTIYPKFDFEDDPAFPYNEVLDIDLDGHPNWFDGWWCGETIIDVVGITSLDDVIVPTWRL